jgi:hypothetical protein
VAQHQIQNGFFNIWKPLADLDAIHSAEIWGQNLGRGDDFRDGIPHNLAEVVTCPGNLAPFLDPLTAHVESVDSDAQDLRGVLLENGFRETSAAVALEISIGIGEEVPFIQHLGGAHVALEIPGLSRETVQTYGISARESARDLGLDRDLGQSTRTDGFRAIQDTFYDVSILALDA